MKMESTQALIKTYRNCEPVPPEIGGEKLKFSKLSRSCQKKVLERYYNIGNQNENTLVYYKKPTDEKPKK